MNSVKILEKNAGVELLRQQTAVLLFCQRIIWQRMRAEEKETDAVWKPEFNDVSLTFYSSWQSVLVWRRIWRHRGLRPPRLTLPYRVHRRTFGGWKKSCLVYPTASLGNINDSILIFRWLYTNENTFILFNSCHIVSLLEGKPVHTKRTCSSFPIPIHKHWINQ